ncbi:MAG: pyridoxamine 5'-phosphate oxidase [Pseudomonadota bacterium]
MSKLNLADIRLDYGRHGLAPDDCHADPLQQLQDWLNAALEAGVNEATAMNLATVDSAGRPSARIVLLKGIEAGQLCFFTNYLSRKGRQLAAQPFAALTFFWPELERQIRIEGRIAKLPDAASDTYFASRPYGSRIGAWVSEQSQPVADAETLMAREAELKARFPEQVLRPPHWGGYGLTPDRVEFWQGRPSRLHDRVLYLPDEHGGWQLSRLQP